MSAVTSRSPPPHAVDRFIRIVRALQVQNRKSRFCDCINDRENVCDHLWEMAWRQLLIEDGDPKKPNSYHESAPPSLATHAPYPSTQREDDLWQRVKAGQDTCRPGHPDDERGNT